MLLSEGERHREHRRAGDHLPAKRGGHLLAFQLHTGEAGRPRTSQCSVAGTGPCPIVRSSRRERAESAACLPACLLATTDCAAGDRVDAGEPRHHAGGDEGVREAAAGGGRAEGEDHPVQQPAPAGVRHHVCVEQVVRWKEGRRANGEGKERREGGKTRMEEG